VILPLTGSPGGGLTVTAGMYGLGIQPHLGLLLMGAGVAVGLWGLVANHRDHIRR
jgi:hypothetical protein